MKDDHHVARGNLEITDVFDSHRPLHPKGNVDAARLMIVLVAMGMSWELDPFGG